MAGKAIDPAENSPQGNTREIVSSSLGISSNTLQREKYIYNHRDDVDPTEYADWNEGRTSTNKVYTSLKASEEQETPKAKNKHDVKLVSIPTSTSNRRLCYVMVAAVGAGMAWHGSARHG